MNPSKHWHWVAPQPTRTPSASILDREQTKPELDELRWGRRDVTHDNQVELYVNGHEVLPRILEAIAQAEQSIHIEVMTFFNDDAGYQIRDALMRRLDATKGRVKVRVIYDYLATSLGDPFMSKGINPLHLTSFMAPLRGAGATVVDSSFVGDENPEQLDRLSQFIPTDLRSSVLNFPYEVRRAYKRLNAAAVRLFSAPRMQRPIERALTWAEEHELALAEQLTPHRLISRYMVHDHRKLIIVDGELGFCGGMNIGQEYLYRHPYDPNVSAARETRQQPNYEPWAKWHDCCCLVRGPVVNRLQNLFLEQLERCGGTPPRDEELERCFPIPATIDGRESGGMKVGVATSVPGKPSGLENEALALIDEARESILLRNPYLVRHGFLSALARAAERGLRPRCVMADDHNDSLIHLGYVRSWYRYLHERGVELREHLNHFSHTKALTVDSRRTLLGSFNYNNRSSVLDFEVGIVIDDESFAETVERRLYHDDVDNGLAMERDGALLPKEAAMIMPALATYELWGTFL